MLVGIVDEGVPSIVELLLGRTEPSVSPFTALIGNARIEEQVAVQAPIILAALRSQASHIAEVGKNSEVI